MEAVVAVNGEVSFDSRNTNTNLILLLGASGCT